MRSLPKGFWVIEDGGGNVTGQPYDYNGLGSAHVIQGNALNLPIADNSIDLICTSPPYFGLRSYQDGGTHYDGQIGSEATPAEFLEALLAATREMVRVLKPSGSIFVNLGDKYSTGNSGDRNSKGRADGIPGGAIRTTKSAPNKEFPPKTLLGVPWRYAIACIDQLGLILRAEIIWAKPNGLPESVTDRVRRSHEQWFHLTKSPRYFSAVDEIREAQIHPNGTQGAGYTLRKRNEAGYAAPTYQYDAPNPLGKLPGSVWTVPTQPLTVPPELGVDHFAAYPMEWPRRIIQGWTPNGICTVCGEGRRPAASAEYTDAGGRGNEKWDRVEQGSGDYQFGSFKPQEMRLGRANRTTTITGYMCACPTPEAPTTPAVCLDPFGGTGTTALVAKALGRTGIIVDLSADYCRLAEWRCNDPGQLAAALQVEKPDPISPDQLALFGENA